MNIVMMVGRNACQKEVMIWLVQTMMNVEVAFVLVDHVLVIAKLRPIV
jgi:hypothetical protein